MHVYEELYLLDGWSSKKCHSILYGSPGSEGGLNRSPGGRGLQFSSWGLSHASNDKCLRNHGCLWHGLWSRGRERSGLWVQTWPPMYIQKQCMLHPMWEKKDSWSCLKCLSAWARNVNSWDSFFVIFDLHTAPTLNRSTWILLVLRWMPMHNLLSDYGEFYLHKHVHVRTCIYYDMSCSSGLMATSACTI